MTKKKPPKELEIESKPNPVGRPPIYKTADEMQNAFDLYVKNCLVKEERPTITGACYELGFESRQSFYKYEEQEEFSYTVKRIRLFIENIYEQRIENGAGPIFALKNFGWTDKSEIGISGQLDTVSESNIDAKIAALSLKLNGINEST